MKFHLIHATAEGITVCSLRRRGSRGSKLDRRKYRRPAVVGIGQFERYKIKARCAVCQADLNKWRGGCPSRHLTPFPKGPPWRRRR